MNHRFFPVLVTILLSTIANPAAANEKPYPELMLRSLVEVCVKEKPKGILVPFISAPTAGAPSDKTLPEIMTEYEKVVNQSIATTQKNQVEQEKAIETQAEQRSVQLQELIKDKDKLKVELTQIQAVIAKGEVNGEKIDPSQMTQLKQAEKDLSRLLQDPNHVKVMAQEFKTQELMGLRKRTTGFVTEATKGLAKIKRCGCTTDRIQKRYSLDELGDRIKLDMTGKDGILKDVKETYGQCPK